VLTSQQVKSFQVFFDTKMQHILFTTIITAYIVSGVGSVAFA